MRDVTLTLEADDGLGGRPSDSVTFTVLWVDEPNIKRFRWDTVADDNDKRNNYKAGTVANTYNLGLQRYNDTFDARLGWGIEARAEASPSAFDYPGNDLKLGRNAQYRIWEGAGATLHESLDYRPAIPPGNDTGPSFAQDNNPTDSNPVGFIYDWDNPGLRSASVSPVNTLRRVRMNFRVFAQLTVRGNLVRASPILSYYVRFSARQMTAPQGGNYEAIATSDPNWVDGDNAADFGETVLTWNLT
jgi:hypothetical protein